MYELMYTTAYKIHISVVKSMVQMVHGTYTNGTWYIHKWYIVHTQMVHGTYTNGTWNIHKWYIVHTQMVHGTVHH